MAIINAGTNFSNGEQLSASKLNDLIDDATFGTDSVDNSTTLVNASGAITVRDSGITAAKLTANSVTTAKIADANVTTAKIADSNITTAKIADASVTLIKLGSDVDLALNDGSVTTAKIADDAVTTAKIADANVTTAKIADVNVTTAKIADANVTKVKIENLTDYTVLGNVSGGAAAPAEVAILDEDDMVSNSDTALATQQSIKTYVDATAGGFTPSTYAGGESVTLPNGLIMKFGNLLIGSSSGGVNITFGTAFPNSCIIALYSAENSSLGASHIQGKSTTGFFVSFQSGVSNRALNWQAFGY